MDEPAQIEVEGASEMEPAVGDNPGSAKGDPLTSERAPASERVSTAERASASERAVEVESAAADALDHAPVFDDEPETQRSPPAPSITRDRDGEQSSGDAIMETPPADIGQAPNEATARLERRLDQVLQLAQRRDELIERLHNENQQLRKGELQVAMLPLLRDLMRLHDDLEQIVALPSESRDAILIRDTLSDVLARNGVTKFIPTEGEVFDSTRHTAVGTQPTEDERADRTVQTVLRAGFLRDDGSTVRVADVVVRRFQAQPRESPSAEKCDEPLSA
jgi:molecular chaperone GrpE (heat shock protein)